MAPTARVGDLPARPGSSGGEPNCIRPSSARQHQGAGSIGRQAFRCVRTPRAGSIAGQRVATSPMIPTRRRQPGPLLSGTTVEGLAVDPQTCMPGTVYLRHIRDRGYRPPAGNPPAAQSRRDGQAAGRGAPTPGAHRPGGSRRDHGRSLPAAAADVDADLSADRGSRPHRAGPTLFPWHPDADTGSAEPGGPAPGPGRGSFRDVRAGGPAGRGGRADPRRIQPHSAACRP